MARWFTADWHLGHAKIIELAHRPFESVDEMNWELIRRFNSTIDWDTNAHTWHLGDFAMGTIATTLPLVGELYGENALVPGNHDRTWPGGNLAKADEWKERYVAAGFQHAFVRLTTFHTMIGESRVQLSHLPYRGDSRDMPDRFPEQRPTDEGEWLLHGHVHERWRQCGRMINVGVDAWGGRPVSEEQIAELIAAGPRDLEPLPWYDERSKDAGN